MIRVRVGIVSWNTASLLDRCLGSLREALVGVDATIVVVDNASCDGSADIAERHSGVKVIRNSENVGYARAMNVALASVDADVLVALNPDTELPPGSFAVLAQRLLDEPDLGLVVPQLVNMDGTLQHSVYRFPSPRQAASILLMPRWALRRGVGKRWWAEGYASHDEATDIDWAIGAVHVIRAAALAGRDPYDERYFMYVEDVDLCWRLARHGWRRRLEPDVHVEHVGNASGAQAWGDERTGRWMTATMDWYAQTFGRSALRRWAAVNIVALFVHLAGSLPRAVLGRSDARVRAHELCRLLRLQLRGVVAPSRPSASTSVRAGSPPVPSER